MYSFSCACFWSVFGAWYSKSHLPRLSVEAVMEAFSYAFVFGCRCRLALTARKWFSDRSGGKTDLQLSSELEIEPTRFRHPRVYLPDCFYPANVRPVPILFLYLVQGLMMSSYHCHVESDGLVAGSNGRIINDCCDVFVV